MLLEGKFTGPARGSISMLYYDLIITDLSSPDNFKTADHDWTWKKRFSRRQNPHRIYQIPQHY